jgi:hypothetical protein
MCHQHEFAQHAASDRGMQAMLAAARAMALTTEELLRDRTLRDAVRAEFEASRTG